MLRVSKNYKATLHIDSEPVKFLIRKLTVEQYTEFAQEFQRLGKMNVGENLDARPRAGEDGLTAEEIQGKRYHELSVEARAALDKAERDEAARGNTFAVDSITSYVVAEPGQIFDEDEERELTSGEDMVRHYGARPDVLRDLVGEIFLQNRLSEEDKKKLRLLRASMRSSPAPRASGNAPDATAPSAEPSNSVASAAVTDSPEPNPSGATD